MFPWLKFVPMLDHGIMKSPSGKTICIRRTAWLPHPYLMRKQCEGITLGVDLVSLRGVVVFEMVHRVFFELHQIRDWIDHKPSPGDKERIISISPLSVA